MFLRSTKLALIAMHHLVEKYYEGVNSAAPNIAEVYNMNPRALMVALRRLTQVGILKSQTGGTHPGFILSKDPKDITMYEFIEALEDINKMTECRNEIEGVNCKFDNCEKCKVYNIVDLGINEVYEQLKVLSLYDHCNIKTSKN